MPDLVFYSATELPDQFVARAARVAAERQYAEMASLFYGFADEWAAVPEGLLVSVASPAVSWRAAKFTQVGRAVLALASHYTDIQDDKEAK